MSVAIISTIYSYEPVIASVAKFGADNLYLLIDPEADENQKKAISEVQKVLGKYIVVKLVKTDVYDIVTISRDVTKLIDEIAPTSKILLNISAGRKTKALGLMFAGYARSEKVDNIFYITKERQSIVFLPKISFTLKNTQKKILEYYGSQQNFSSMKEIYHKLNVSKSMFYKTLNELRDMGFIHKNKITDAGEIALL